MKMNLNDAKKIFKYLVASAIVLEVILVAFIIKWYALRQRQMKSTLCFNDESLKSVRWKSEIVQNLTLRYGKGTTQNAHCYDAVDVLNFFVRQLMVLHFNTDISPEHRTFNFTMFNKTVSTELLALLHLSDIQKVEPSVQQDNQSKIFWKKSLRQGDGLSYLEREGMVAIHTSGYYHVATHLTIIKENKTISTDNELATHQVIRISDKTDKESVLLEHISAQCLIPAKQYEQTSYMAAAFKLEKSDRIFVTFSHPYKIVSGNGGHYFSIIEI